MSQIFETLGGLGVFLLGVVIMTAGLKGVAADALRAALTRFTHSPFSGACTGALSTAILQSSSATTVAAVGFVGAGLLSFPQALGIIFGANVGTTITGWLVALIGFKFKLGSVVMPLILGGVLMHLFGRGRWQQAGLALAGFGLIFVGIATMQAGMSSLQGQVTPDSFPSDTLFGRLQLVLIGIAITLVTQSSSAGVAAALTAVHTGTISFEQGAAMVIGMDVGTTATALFATMGGAADTRRTGYSHVVYNLLTGLGALVLLSPYVWLWSWLAPGQLAAQAEIALVAFHTSFNALGVILILPLAQPFSRLMYRLVPETRSRLVRQLDTHLLSDDFVALEAAHSTQEAIFRAQLDIARDVLAGPPLRQAERLDEIADALQASEHYLDQIHSQPERGREWQMLVACMHSLDHMQRLQHRLHKAASAITLWRSETAANERVAQLSESLARMLAAPHWMQAEAQAKEIASRLQASHRQVRDSIMSDIVAGRIEAERGGERLDADRWLMRVGHHLWRISHHLQRADEASHRDSVALETA